MAGWDPQTERSHPEIPAHGQDPETPPKISEGDPETSARDPKISKRSPPSPQGDPKISKRDPPSPKRAPPEKGDPLGDGGFGGVAERWRPETRPPARTRLRNRRYAALRQLIQDGEYFSEEEMRAREPLLYQHYIGRYRGADPLPGDPQNVPCPSASQKNILGTPPPPQTLSGLLLRSVEEAAVQRRLRHQRLRDGDSGDEEGDPEIPDAAERAMLREEFTSRMYQRFLDGEDGDFDYSQIDENPDLDNLDIVSRDAEERYFDEEEPSDAPQLE